MTTSTSCLQDQPRRTALPLDELRDRLAVLMPPPVPAEPQVWVQPIGADRSDRSSWVCLGPRGDVCREYPDIAEIISRWIPCPTLLEHALGSCLTVAPGIRLWTVLIGEGNRG